MGQPEDEEKQQINEHERRTAIRPCNEGEPPYIAKAYGAARRKEQKTNAAVQTFSLLHHLVLCGNIPPHASVSVLALPRRSERPACHDGLAVACNETACHKQEPCVFP